MGAAESAAVCLSRHLHTAGTIAAEPVQTVFVGRCGQHHLKHRPRTERRKGPIDEGSIVGPNAVRYPVHIIGGHAHTGKHLTRGSVHHKNTAPWHVLRRDALADTLDIRVQCKLHPLPGPLFQRDDFRLAPSLQSAPRGGPALDDLPVSGGGKNGIEGFFQPRHTMSFSVQIPQQVDRDGRLQAPRRILTGKNSQSGQVPFRLHKKRRGCVAPLIQKSLGFVGNIGKQSGIAGISGDAQRIPAPEGAGEKATVSVCKVSSLDRQFCLAHSLDPGVSGIGCLGPDPVHPAKRHRKKNQQRTADKAQAAHRHKTAPFRA